MRATVAIVLAAAFGMGAQLAESQTPPPAPEATVPHAKFLRAVTLMRREHRETLGLRRTLADERRFTRLVRNPSPKNNRALAKILFPDVEFEALDKIANGESDWHHTVWNGGKLGGDTPGPTARPCGTPGAYAYGIGQACPRLKMAEWAGTEAVYRTNSLQLYWMRSYAEGRYGSLEAAGNHWTAEMSW